MVEAELCRNVDLKGQSLQPELCVLVDGHA